MVALMTFDIGEYLQAIYCPATPPPLDTLVIDGITLLGGVGIRLLSLDIYKKSHLNRLYL